MTSQRTATILHLPVSGLHQDLWQQVAAHLGRPDLTARLIRRPWYWLNRIASGSEITQPN